MSRKKQITCAVAMHFILYISIMLNPQILQLYKIIIYYTHYLLFIFIALINSYDSNEILIITSYKYINDLFIFLNQFQYLKLLLNINLDLFYKNMTLIFYKNET